MSNERMNAIKNAKFFQNTSPHKKKRGTSSPVDGPGSFNQPNKNIHNFLRKVNRQMNKKALLCMKTLYQSVYSRQKIGNIVYI